MHRLLIEMIHRSRLSRNFIRWLWCTSAATRRCDLTNSTTHLPARCGLGSQRSVISPALFNRFVSDYPISDPDMTSYADDFTLLASALSIVESEARANRLCSLLMRWADGNQLAIAPQKSSVTKFTSYTHQSRFHPQNFII